MGECECELQAELEKRGISLRGYNKKVTQGKSEQETQGGDRGRGY